jgi:hypothetical protein
VSGYLRALQAHAYSLLRAVGSVTRTLPRVPTPEASTSARRSISPGALDFA